jgi:hypothetical protein
MSSNGSMQQGDQEEKKGEKEKLMIKEAAWEKRKRSWNSDLYN